MSDQSTALVPRRHMTPEQRRHRDHLFPHPSRRGYPPSTKKKVITLLTLQAESISKICSMPGMPSENTIWMWCQSDPVFAAAYEQSKRIRAARLVETVLNDIASVGPRDREAAQVMDAKARHRLKIAALYDPAKYSEGMQGALNRLPTGNAVQISINIGGQPTETVTIEGKVSDLNKSG
jgi:hypothetical protein